MSPARVKSGGRIRKGWHDNRGDVGISRRSLVGLGLGLGAGMVSGCASGSGQVSTKPEPVTFDSWSASASRPLFIGHRGAAGIVPEHSLEGYLHAIDSGMRAVEISTCVSSDGAVYCMHDTRLDRTTTLHGEVASATSTAIDEGRILVPRLGPGWLGDNMPRIPRLIDVMSEIRGRAVLCIEAKVGAALEPMLDIVKSFNALDTVMFKTPIGSPHVERARELDLPVFGYLGAASDITPANLATAKATLTHPQDVLVVPTRLAGSFVDDHLLRSLRGAAPELWVYATHRRSEVAHYRRRGVQGFVASNPGYAVGVEAPVKVSDWSAGRLPSGLLTRDPYSDSQGIDWKVLGAIRIDATAGATYLTLADLTPVAGTNRYTLQMTVAIDHVASPDAGLALVLCAPSDESPDRDSSPAGYLGRWTVSGKLSLAAADMPTRELASVYAPGPEAGEWVTIEVAVDPAAITLSIGDAHISITDQRWRAGYIHVGGFGGVGHVTLRDATIT